MKGFNQIQEHPTHFVLHHTNGHQVHIAKNGLSKKTLQQIQAFAGGGEVNYGASSQNTLDTDKAAAFRKAMGGNPPSTPKPDQSKSTTNPVKVASYADGGEVADPTLGLEPTQNYTPAPQPEIQLQPQVEEPQRDLSNMSGLEQISSLAKSIGEKAKKAYNAVDSTQLGHTLLSGGAGTPPSHPAASANPNVQPAVVQSGQPSAQFTPVNLGSAQPAVNNGIPLPDYGAQYQQATNQMLGGLRQQAEAEGALGKEQASVYQKQADQYQALLNDYQDQQKSLNDEIENVKQDVADGHIEPNRMFENMGTGQKISTALGLILGGIGGGLTHQENPVMKFINQQIDRDIDAQKANLGKKENLLSKMLQQYGTIDAAKNAARMNYMAMVEGQLGKLAAQAKDPLAKARYQEMAGKLRMDMAPTMSQLAIQQAGFKMLQGQEGQQNPAIAVRFIVPKEQQGEAYKELSSLQAMKKGGENALNAFDKVSQMSLSGAFSPRQKAALLQPVTAQLSKETAGRFTEQDSQMLDKLWPAVGDTEQTKMVKRQAVIRLLKEKMNSPLLDSYGIKLPMFGTGKPLNTHPNFQQAGMMPIGNKQ
jgi:hypothetical protein